MFSLQEDVNVFCVDWAPGAADPNYVRAAVNTRLVGKQVRSCRGYHNEKNRVTLQVSDILVGMPLILVVPFPLSALFCSGG